MITHAAAHGFVTDLGARDLAVPRSAGGREEVVCLECCSDFSVDQRRATGAGAREPAAGPVCY